MFCAKHEALAGYTKQIDGIVYEVQYLTQMLNVWPIYLHLGSFGGKCR